MYCYGPSMQWNVVDIIDNVICMLRSLCGSCLYLFKQEEGPVPLVFCSCLVLVTVLRDWDLLCPTDVSFKCFIVPVDRSRTIFQNVHSFKTNCDDPLSKTFGSNKDILNNQVQGEKLIMRTEFIILRWVGRSGGVMNITWTKRPDLIQLNNLHSSTSTTCLHPPQQPVLILL
jgi:hypothetical protein